MIEFSNYQAAIFDLDGVITDTAPFHFQAWKALADILNITFTEEHNELLKGVDRMSSLDILLGLGDKEFSPEEKQQMAADKNIYYQQLIEQLTADDILPGVLPLLDILAQMNIKLGLASASRNAKTILNGLQIADRFDYIADPTYARSKPAPDIFLYAAYGLKIHPTQCIAFEDSIAGLQSIKESSMYAVSVGMDELSQYSDTHVHRLDELLN